MDEQDKQAFIDSGLTVCPRCGKRHITNVTTLRRCLDSDEYTQVFGCFSCEFLIRMFFKVNRTESIIMDPNYSA